MPEQIRAACRVGASVVRFRLLSAQGASILDGQTTDLEWLDVAHHLIQLALVVKPESLTLQVLLAKVLLRYGERDKALAVLEDVRVPKPEKFASGEDEDAWYQSCQLLSDLYMELNRADLAVACLIDFRQSSKSGAQHALQDGAGV